MLTHNSPTCTSVQIMAIMVIQHILEELRDHRNTLHVLDARFAVLGLAQSDGLLDATEDPDAPVELVLRFGATAERNMV